MLIVVLAVLAVVAVVAWQFRPTTEVAAEFSEAMQTYHCPHCNSDFEISGPDAQAQLSAGQSITCPNCSKSIDDWSSAIRHADAVEEIQDVEESPVPRAVGGVQIQRR